MVRAHSELFQNVVKKALADSLRPGVFLAQLKESGASSMEASGVDRQVLLHASLRTKNDRLAREHLTGSMRWKEPIFSVVVTNTLLKLRLNGKSL